MAKSIWVQSYCETIWYEIPSARHFTSQQFGISADLTCSKQLKRGKSPRIFRTLPLQEEFWQDR